MKRIVLIVTILAGLHADAQNLNGIWKGSLTQQPGGCFPVYNVELQINSKDGKASGFCYHYSDLSNYVKKDYTGVINESTKTVNIQEQKVITFHIPSECTPCIRYFSLSYQRLGNEETLSGDWGGVMMNGSAACTPGKIVLHRVAESEFAHIQEIKVDTGKLRLDFYDNAQIDGDSISVMVNNNIILTHQRLSTKPITVEVAVDIKNPVQEVTMIAENLGSIPPNTALLIVTAGTKRYRLFLSSSDKKNAQVRFIYEPELLER